MATGCNGNDDIAVKTEQMTKTTKLCKSISDRGKCMGKIVVYFY
jgi:hypothetical protein